MLHDTEFPSGDATLRGRLYLPRGERRVPLVIMGHGFSATIDGMVAERYAEAFQAAGLAVLLYDHSGFGPSGGQPRLQIDRWRQVMGYRHALDFAAELASEGLIDAERVALWGDSMSGACALVAAAFDRRVSALVLQVPALGAGRAPSDPAATVVRSMGAIYAGGQLAPPIGADGPMPVVSSDQLRTRSALTPVTAFRWFMAHGAAFGTNWHNEVTIARRGPAEPFQPVPCSALVTCPTLFVIAREDEMPGADAEVARFAARRCGGLTEVLEIDGGHFGLLYDRSDVFAQASSTECSFLVRHLASGGTVDDDVIRTGRPLPRAATAGRAAGPGGPRRRS